MIRNLSRSWRALSCVKDIRCFHATPRRYEIRDIKELPDRIYPSFHDTKSHELLKLHWPAPLRNVLLTKKETSADITASLVGFAKHIQSTYPSIGIILEPHTAAEIHENFSFPVYTELAGDSTVYANKVDIVSTLGGDGTILHASALFASSDDVPPVLSFSMGTLGFLGEWRFEEYKRAFREVYSSGASAGYGSKLFSKEGSELENKSTQVSQEISQDLPAEWPSLRGKSMGSGRSARILLRNRLKVQIQSTESSSSSAADTVSSSSSPSSPSPSPIYAMNEVIIHRGGTPHLAIVDVHIGGKFLTSAVADGMIVCTPTGSTAYSLSSGGAIVHPLVSSLMLTPICPRSLSFRPLVLPAHIPISLRLASANRAKEVDISIDGVRQPVGLSKGMEVQVWGQGVRDYEGNWKGGVPSVVRGSQDQGAEDHWVGGLNGLLKFNYPFGEA